MGWRGEEECDCGRRNSGGGAGWKYWSKGRESGGLLGNRNVTEDGDRGKREIAGIGADADK